MTAAFCTAAPLLRVGQRSVLISSVQINNNGLVRCAARKGQDSIGKANNPKSKRAKRPRSSKPNSGFSAPKTDEQPVVSRQSSEQDPAVQSEDVKGRDLQKKDASGITLENRLREEIAHPLRKPKLTLFGSLAFSATIGLLFALARAQKDSVAHVAESVAVDIAAIGFFGWLAWREVQFGRRSLNSLAGQPEARDLKVVMLIKDSGLSLPFTGNDNVKLLGELSRGNDVIIAAGRASDLRKYLSRCNEDAQPSAVRIVALPTDINREAVDGFDGAIAVASGESGHQRDWVAWVGEAVPPRNNIALFKVSAGEDEFKSASSYVVAVSDPSTLPLPRDAKRELSEV